MVRVFCMSWSKNHIHKRLQFITKYYLHMYPLKHSHSCSTGSICSNSTYRKIREAFEENTGHLHSMFTNFIHFTKSSTFAYVFAPIIYKYTLYVGLLHFFIWIYFIVYICKCNLYYILHVI